MNLIKPRDSPVIARWGPCLLQRLKSSPTFCLEVRNDHRQQPTRLPCPWDSPGKNTGVGCHFLLQHSPRDSQKSSPMPQFKSINSSALSSSLWSNSHIHTWLLEKPTCFLLALCSLSRAMHFCYWCFSQGKLLFPLSPFASPNFLCIRCSSENIQSLLRCL